MVEIRNKWLFDLIISLFYVLLLIDSINGYLLKSLGLSFPLSQGYKIILQVLMLLHLVSLNSKRLFIFILITVLLFIPILINVTIYFEDYLFRETLIQIDKFIYVLLVFYYFVELINQYEEISIKKILKIFYFNSIILIGNLVIGILGFGHTQYVNEGGNIGTRGFFYAGNEMAGLIITLFTLCLFHIYQKRNKKKYYLSSLFFLFLAAISSTKVGILGMIISIVIVPKLATRPKKLLLKLKINIKKLLIIGFSLLAGIFISIKIIVKSGLWNRWTYFYEIKFKEGLFTFLLSGRNLEAKEQLSAFFSDTIIAQIIFGIGANDKRIVEMDIIDILINYGCWGLILFYLFFFFIYNKTLTKIKDVRYPYSRLALYAMSILFIISSFTGHIIFSAMTGTFISLISAIGFYKNAQI